jgi:hypothetical protein
MCYLATAERSVNALACSLCVVSDTTHSLKPRGSAEIADALCFGKFRSITDFEDRLGLVFQLQDFVKPLPYVHIDTWATKVAAQCIMSHRVEALKSL